MPPAAQRNPRPQSPALDRLLREGRVTVAGHAEANAVFEEWFAREAAKRPTRAQVAEGGEYLAKQEPDEKVSPLCQAYNEALERLGQDEADRIAGGLLEEKRAAPAMGSHSDMVAELRRRVDTAHVLARSRARADALPTAAPARSDSRPREHRGARRAGNSRDGPDSESDPPRRCAACDEPLGPDRTAAAKYCPGSKCRKAAARRRRAHEPGPLPPEAQAEWTRRAEEGYRAVTNGADPVWALLTILAPTLEAVPPVPDRRTVFA